MTPIGHLLQLGILKRENEQQHLIREDMEMELQGLKNQMVLMQAAFDEASAWGEDKILEAVSGRNEAQRFVLATFCRLSNSEIMGVNHKLNFCCCVSYRNAGSTTGQCDLSIICIEILM